MGGINVLVALCFSIGALGSPVENALISGAAPKGYKVQWVGHSFHAYLSLPVGSLAREAGIQGHTSIGNEFLPASYPCQHWTLNPTGVKAKLEAGKADVLTLATREMAPDECIGKFAELAVRDLLAITDISFNDKLVQRQQEHPSHGPR